MDTERGKKQIEWLENDVKTRFLRYVKIETTSDRHADNTPSTEGQWTLLRLLRDELIELGIEDVELDENGFLIGRMQSNVRDGKEVPVIGFLAHVDTSAEAPGVDVTPQIHHKYDGSPIALKRGTVIDPAEFPELRKYIGQTIITADGTTLLGADDKAGVAEIMTAVAWLLKHPELPHGQIEVVFTPDEETGKGMDRFPREKILSSYCYTLDGDGGGIIEAECFYGYSVSLIFKGVAIHPGHARGKMVNAVSMAGSFLSMLPRNESPEATDGAYGFYLPLEIRGNSSRTAVDVFLRDFQKEEIDRRIETVRAMAGAVEKIYPGGSVSVSIRKQYSNMREYISKAPKGVELLKEAIQKTGLQPEMKQIRGGTDGARLSELGIPTPNVFTGGANFHGEKEWAALSIMAKASQTIVELTGLWATRAQLPYTEKFH